MITDALTSEADLRAFLELPGVLYRGDRDYLAEPESKTRASLLRAAFLDRQRAFLFRSGSAPRARVVARLSPVLRDAAAKPLGMLGFFEAYDDPNAIGELLREAIEWLRERGAETIVGPLDGDTWHRYRFNVGPFEQPPFLMEPYNKPYYGAAWERAGFQPLQSYYSKFTDARVAANDLARIHRRVLARGYRLRPMLPSRFEDEIRIIYELSLKIFADNYLYEPITWDDFLALYEPARRLIDPELVLIAETADGEPVGFLFAVVDYHRAVAAMRGGSGVMAKLRFLMQRHRADAVNLKSLGVLAGHRRSGLAAALTCAGYLATLQRGFQRANLCLIRDGNPSGRLDGDHGTVIRRYVLYQYASGGS